MAYVLLAILFRPTQTIDQLSIVGLGDFGAILIGSRPGKHNTTFSTLCNTTSSTSISQESLCYLFPSFGIVLLFLQQQ